MCECDCGCTPCNLADPDDRNHDECECRFDECECVEECGCE